MSWKEHYPHFLCEWRGSGAGEGGHDKNFLIMKENVLFHSDLGSRRKGKKRAED